MWLLQEPIWLLSEKNWPLWEPIRLLWEAIWPLWETNLCLKRIP